MLGAIVGDIVGSVYEFNNHKSAEFLFFKKDCFFTDDTVMTLAVAEGIMNGGRPEDYIAAMRRLGALYPNCSFGARFTEWLRSDDPKPYGSFGNGSAMRVSPAGWAGKTLDDALRMARESAAVTHDHPEGIKGAEAAAAAVWLARNGKSRDEIREYIRLNYYPLDFRLDEIRDSYKFDETCQGSVPQAIEAFLESSDFISAVRLAVSIGGDSDTIASITGAIAEAYYGLPGFARLQALSYLDDELRDIVTRWEEK